MCIRLTVRHVRYHFNSYCESQMHFLHSFLPRNEYLATTQQIIQIISKIGKEAKRNK